MHSPLVTAITAITGFLIVFETLNAVLLHLFPLTDVQMPSAWRGRNAPNTRRKIKFKP